MEFKWKDTIDKLEIFLAKRDGIDKIVKTLEYMGKLAHYNLEAKNPILEARYKNLEVAAGMSRKVFRAERTLTSFNALHTATYPDLTIQLLAIFGYRGEMVYWLFDHFTWLSNVGVLNPTVADSTIDISAFGNNVVYIFFITIDVILIKRGMKAELGFKKQLAKLERSEHGLAKNLTNAEQVKILKSKFAAIKMQRVMSVMSVVARIFDLFITLSVVDPNPFVNHTVTLGLSGLAPAWAGW